MTTFAPCRRLLPALLLSLASVVGCAAEGGDERPAAWRGHASEASLSQEAAEPPGTPCAENAQRDCVVEIDQASGVHSCWRGVQFCVEGAWSECYASN